MYAVKSHVLMTIQQSVLVVDVTVVMQFCKVLMIITSKLITFMNVKSA